ncbi:MAG TPA: AAA family ATPase [bacterium]|nr:AAA family ATPase [bacterium]
MERFFFDKLLEWKDNIDRLVLLVRGARQVGKTYLIRELGKTFDNFIEINFEMDKDVAIFFDGSLDPVLIAEKISIFSGKPIVPGRTLLFFDEIQSCPNALRSLRFFYEKMSELHVVAAGSLLEFALSEIPSFGVGRIESLFLYPMTFFEFLNAMDEQQLVKYIKSRSFKEPADEVLHKKALELFRKYQIIGGLPAAVKKYVENKDMLGCQKVIDNLVTTLRDDFAKYKDLVSLEKMDEAFRSAADQTGSKFVYSRISNERSSHYRTALNMIISAGLAYKVFHTSARGIPLGAAINDSKFKVMLLDTGIFQRLSGLDLAEFIVQTDLINKGALAELSVALALVSIQKPHRRPELYYWHREQRGSSAEVDFVISIGGKIIPVEVKSGTKGAMQSMYLFMEERKTELGIRISSENFAKYDKVAVIPIYATENLENILREAGWIIGALI